MSGRQTYIDQRHHTKLKAHSLHTGKDMKEIVEGFIDDLDTPEEEIDKVRQMKGLA